MRCSVLRPQRQDVPVPGDGGFELALGVEEVGEAKKRFDVIGRELHRLAIAGERLIRGAPRLVHTPEVAVRMRVRAIYGERLRNQLGGALVSPLLMGDEAEQMQRVRVSRLEGKHLLIGRLGVGKPSCAVMRDGRFEKLRRGGHAANSRVVAEMRKNGEQRCRTPQAFA